jgi:hypothetical protein
MSSDGIVQPLIRAADIDRIVGEIALNYACFSAFSNKDAK